MKRKTIFLLVALASVVLMSNVITLIFATAILAPVASSSSWEGTGEGTTTVVASTPRITEVYIDKKSIDPGNWVTIRVKATNDGPDNAPIQTIHIGLPFDPPDSYSQFVATDMDSWQKYKKGDTIWVAGEEKTAKYPFFEGYEDPWTTGYTRYLTIKVKFPDIDSVVFDVKTVACDEDWNVIGRDPTSGMKDQQGEYVHPYLILRKFTATVAPTGTQEVEISITNHNRQPYVGTQPSMTVTSFSVTNYGGFNTAKGSITATNIPFTITPSSTGTLRIKITTSNHPRGTFNIEYKVSGTP